MQKARSGAGKPDHRTRSPIETGCPEGKCRPPDAGGLTLEGAWGQGSSTKHNVRFRPQEDRRDAVSLARLSTGEANDLLVVRKKATQCLSNFSLTKWLG